MYKHENLTSSTLESPRIPYVSKRAKGIYANILLDYWFKRTFAELPFSERLLILLLQELIPERKIASLSYVHQEHTNPYPDARGVRVDVEVTDENGSRFLVEMQREPQDWFYERAIYYASHCILQQMPQGQDDFSFPPVYFIGIMDFALHDDPQRVMYRYALREDQDKDLMTDSLHFIFLELPNCGRALTPQATVLDNFCFALHNMQFLEERPDVLRQEIFDLLFEAAEIATFTPEDKVKYEFEMTTERDIRNQIAFAKKNARAEGIIEGKAEGRMENGIESARRMLEDHLPIETIAKYSGLSIEQVLDLQKEA